LIIGLAGVFGVPPLFSGNLSQSLLPHIKKASEAGVPDSTISRLLAYGYDNGLKPAHISELLALIVRVIHQKLPPKPFIQKLEEGLAKRVDPELLVSVLSKKIENYLFVKTSIKEVYHITLDPRDECLPIMAESLALGLSKNEFKSLLKQSPGFLKHSLAIAMENKALLKQLHFDENLMNQMLTAILGTEHLSPEWRNLSKIISACKKRGIPDKKIHRAVVDLLKKQGRLFEILPTLGFTDRDLKHGPSESGMKRPI
jgi:hypothetical protein